MSYTDLTAMILRILERQRDAILHGDLAHLAQDTLLLGRLVPRLAATQPTPQILTQIQTAAQRNAALLFSAKQGIDDAKRLLGQSGAQSFSTYTVSGQRQTITAPQSTLSRQS
ncbi:hypothetical protein OE810_06200 [Rhodobacteraceae bacterium XHP0102]|nr:hypothetical protein [Rhodobacteraceae bacterium XHP0102]